VFSAGAVIERGAGCRQSGQRAERSERLMLCQAVKVPCSGHS
jgi:hypothetical protein